MKVEKPGRPARAERAAAAYSKAGVREAAAPVPVTPATAASVLGIPEAEFTPSVRDAIMTLMHEVERLRRDVEQARSRLEDMARTADEDMLLPILNRRAFVREITRFTSFAERYGTPSSLIYFDFNDFKSVNDAHGHSAGDAVLKHFSELIKRQIRDSDILARLGGDEFGVILSHINAEQAKRKAASLAKAIQQSPAVWQTRKIPLKVSYGVYELKAGESPDAAMKQADDAMYSQKRSGR